MSIIVKLIRLPLAILDQAVEVSTIDINSACINVSSTALDYPTY